MSLFRSDRMGYYNVLVPREYAWEVLNELGELDAIQFVDLNSQEATFKRPYSKFVKRAEDLETQISSIEHAMTRFDVPIERCDDHQIFLTSLKDVLFSRSSKADCTYFDDLETELEEKVRSLNEHIKSYDALIENHNHLIEFRQVLLQTRPYIGDSEFRAQYAGEDASGMKNDSLTRGNIRFNYLAGVINREDGLRFKRILFRVTRGMTWTCLLDISKPENIEKEYTSYFKESANGEVKDKSVFLIVYQGGSLDMMKAKLNRVCDSFGASKYGIPEDPIGFNKKLVDIDGQLREAQNIINITQGQIKSLLNWFSQPSTHKVTHSKIEDFRLFVIKEKAVYHNLNTLKDQNTVYQGSCWCPIDSVHKVREAIRNLKQRKPEIEVCEFKDATMPTHTKPPTHFRLNDVTWVYQEIVNTYGVPRYREINPGLFTIVTFPFLFGIMFGDIGHGALVFAFGAYLCMFKESVEKEKKSLSFALLPLRYLLVLQGFFAFYAGLIYNDFMAMPTNLFGTCYNGHPEQGERYVTKFSDSCTYPVGIDPSWYGTTNELTFLNSFKMKASIILGVSQMVFGLILRGINNFHFNMWLEFFFEFIPMLVFFSLTFGYMAVLIFFKWSIPWGTEEYPTSQAPSIINIFIKMALSPGTWDENQGLPLYGDGEGKEQAELQSYFLMIAVICAILILVPKPLILYFKHGRSSIPAGYFEQHDEPTFNEKLLTEGNDEGQALQKVPAPEVHSGHGDHSRGFNFEEVIVHQVIETIEFVLGSISNTASYLRLWALSLAHSQLSKVFFDSTIGAAIVSGGFFSAFFGFFFFAMAILNVLLQMDLFECFLHALRLHWMEFQENIEIKLYCFTMSDTLKINPLEPADLDHRRRITKT